MKAKNETYAQAITTLFSDKVDWKNVCIELAKINPELFLECVESSGGVVPGKLTEDEKFYLAILRRPNINCVPKIQAIKTYRDKTGATLYDAKVAIEAMEAKFLEKGLLKKD